MAAIVCDDHPLMRGALALLVEELAGPAFTAADYAQAWQIASARDDITLCVVDLHMAGTPPIEGLAELMRRAPGARVVVVTASTCDHELAAALALGIHGYVPKSVSGGVMEAAIALVLAGGRYLPERLVALSANDPNPAGIATRTGPVVVENGRLSPRHLDVLDQLSRGRSNKEIARLLGLSPATIKTHLSHIFAVLGAGNRTGAVAMARERGLL